MTRRMPDELHFSSFDGCRIFYRSWRPEREGADRALVILHRGHEHSGRVAALASDLGLDDFIVFAWDQRGHGKSPGVRGYADHISDFVRDLDCFIKHIAATHRISVENIAVLGHSVAGVLAAQWVHDYAPRIRALILATPAFDVKLYVPLALPALRAWQWLAARMGWKKPFVKSYVQGKALTHSAAEARLYDEDPLVSKQIAANILIDLFDSAARLLPDAGAITTPTLLLSARADWVVKNEPQRRFFERLSTSVRDVEVYRGFYHSIFHELDRERPIAAIRTFLKRAFAVPVDRSELLRADRSGFTHEEYQWLRAGLPLLSPRRFMYRVQRLLMRTVGVASEGIRIGWQHGFDSGQSLDHVYKNTPAGSSKLGILMDRAYLDSVGWKGIRARKLNIEELVRQSISQVRTEQGSDGSTIRIADLAGGPGRYLLDLVKSQGDLSMEVTIRDWSETALDEGRRIAQSYGLGSAVTYERADAFDRDAVAALGPDLDIGIVSGLYELFPSNEPLERSLEGLAAAIRPGGYLIYTNQPWHPQLEMICEVLLNRDGEPWIMRRRTQAEMDELVRAAGFEKVDMRIDRYGIFTVSAARRISS